MQEATKTTAEKSHSVHKGISKRENHTSQSPPMR